jgi:outer membrane protein TolC
MRKMAACLHKGCAKKAHPFLISLLWLVAAPAIYAQTSNTPQLQLARPQGENAPPMVITLQDALDRARRFDVQVQSARTDAAIAREDRAQARSSLLPGVINTTQDLVTQGNGLVPSGRYVTNDGVHVYREQAIAHQVVNADTFKKTNVRRADAAQALAVAKIEIAQRGLAVTVTKNYYALVTSQRKYATAQTSLQSAQRFLDVTQRQENAGQVAHADVVRALLQHEQQRAAFQESMLGMENARLNLAVLLFPALNENFTVVDDLDSPRNLPGFPDLESMAQKQNPDLRVAEATLRGADLDIQLARQAYLPVFTLDAHYGIEANCFLLHCESAAFREKGNLPNLGFFLEGHLDIPIFDWGTRQSRVRQARTRQELAQTQLTLTQRQLMVNLYAYYNEAEASRQAVEGLRRAADFAAQNVQLVELRYGAGESTALEVVDAQKTLVDARNAYDDAQTRYRIAIATLQTLTGSF